MAATASMPPRIPEKKLYRIGEVSRITATKAFVLRYWESEFPTLRPVKSPSGHRLYRREDIEAVFEIKRLLYEEGFTIAGARRHLAEQLAERTAEHASGMGERGAAAGTEGRLAEVRRMPEPPSLSRAQRKLLLDLREELQAILTLLEPR